VNALPRKKRESGVTLVELLVAIGIMAIVSTMILGIWFAVSKSFVHTARVSEQVDFARQAISRMAREIRDAQGVQGTADVPVAFVLTDANEIRFYSTFNTTDASIPKSAPRLTRYRYVVTNADEGTGYLCREFPGPDGVFNSPTSPSTDDVSTIIVRDVSNAREHTDVFVYWAYDPLGAAFYSKGTTTTVTPSQMVSVSINLLLDVNPGKSPNYTAVGTTVNPRNVRRF